MRGEAVLDVEPELATVSIRVEAQAGDQPTAMELLTARSRAVSDVVARFASGVERSETSRLHVYADLRHKKTEKVRRYAGSVSTSVTVHDFAVLSDLLVAASAIELASVDGPYWRLRPTSPVYREARVAAAADALNRARDYAAAYGAEVLSLVEIADEGMSYEEPQPMVMSMASRAVGSFGPETLDDGFDLSPARQHVSGRVEARFSLSRPDLALVVPSDRQD